MEETTAIKNFIDDMVKEKDELIENIKYLEIQELWKSVVINNSSINNEPFAVADKAVSIFKRKFNS